MPAKNYIKPLGLSVSALAKALPLPFSRLRDVVAGKRAVTADMALRLERYFGSEAQGWLNRQSAYDLCIARQVAGGSIARDVMPLGSRGR
ncbi:HigA family addiction module antitoxin [Paraburkholderia sp. WSM4175]|uniref:HigA family addiction module antitoxin n=1 Tax=Paraburkholderia sp. WSM4175 TaxID=2991072 RepID=UPI003D208F10